MLDTTGTEEKNEDVSTGKDSKQTAGIYSTGFNLANLILGVGALAMPQAFSNSGIINGLLLLMIMCICGHFTSMLIVKCADKAGVDSYEKLTEKILGSFGYIFFCMLCTFTCIGAAVKKFPNNFIFNFFQKKKKNQSVKCQKFFETTQNI